MINCDEMCWAGVEKDVSWKFSKLSSVVSISLSIKFLYSLFQMLI